MRILENIEELKTLVGQEIGISEWTTISQDRINKFADATGDHIYPGGALLGDDPRDLNKRIGGQSPQPVRKFHHLDFSSPRI